MLTVQPDRDLIRDAIEYGGEFKKCYQCATCVSVCSLSTAENDFPRRPVLLAQWGMKEELLSDPAPWLCFYCGECSKVCPRKANPGESMMALRRYLTTQYDWTGLSRLMYRSGAWEIGILLLVAAIVALLFTLPSTFGFGLLRHSGPQALATVMLDKFAPVQTVHLGDRLLALLLAFFLFTNASRMFFCLTRGTNLSLHACLTQMPNFLAQALTQVRWKHCNDGDAFRNWIRHLFLVTGYGTMFSLVVLFLPWFQVQDRGFHWTAFLGYYATMVLIGTTAWILKDRIWPKAEMHRFSHLSDWLFPILLLLTAASGIAVHVLRLMNLPMATYWTYTVHLMIAVPMLVVEVPFGKWSHLLYRPLAIYIAAVIAQGATTAANEAVPITSIGEHA